MGCRTPAVVTRAASAGAAMPVAAGGVLAGQVHQGFTVVTGIPGGAAACVNENRHNITRRRGVVTSATVEARRGQAFVDVFTADWLPVPVEVGAAGQIEIGRAVGDRLEPRVTRIP